MSRMTSLPLYDFCILDKNEFRYFASHRKRRLKGWEHWLPRDGKGLNHLQVLLSSLLGRPDIRRSRGLRVYNSPAGWLLVYLQMRYNLIEG